MDDAIQVTNLGKWYRRRGVGLPTLVGETARWFRRRPEDGFWALRNVTFRVPPGRTVGVVGPNGSGKSSTLGLVAGTIHPTEGGVVTRGRVASLLELGAGFHPDLSGRENVFLNAALLGIAREDVARRLDAIIDFSGLRDFIDMPVKHYSSGMYVRLAFAVAVEMDPDILLVDEVLAVGDLAFQLKCYDRIRDLQKRAKTLLFVSHDLTAVEQFCHEVKLIHQGRLVAEGDPSTVILTYLKSYMATIGQLNVQEYGTREVEMTGVRMLDHQGAEGGPFVTGQRMTVEIRYRAPRRIERPVFGFSVKTGTGFFIFGTNTQIMNHPVEAVEGEGTMRLSFDPLTLMAGKYFLSLSVHSWDHAVQYHRREDWHPFAVRSATPAEGLFHLDCRWALAPGDAAPGNAR